MVGDEPFIAEMQAASREECRVVLRPVKPASLAAGDIAIDEDLFAIGRNETPFASYAAETVAELSRRHARLFRERGEPYVADLGSKNGTFVNGERVGDTPQRLRDGDELGLGGALAYRVQIVRRSTQPRRPGALVSLTLTPERDDLGLQPIVVARFPFLIGKIDEAFARYRDLYPHQVNYLSRRHAHLFLRGGRPFVEDLGSTNGTFVGGRRLDEHAVELHDGDVIAFAGTHFVYRVSLECEPEADPTLTRMRPDALRAEAAADKTTFIAAPDSFLDIFCVDPAPQPADEVNAEAAAPPSDASRPAAKERLRRGAKGRRRSTILFGEIVRAFGGGGGLRRALKWGVPIVALVVAAGVVQYRAGADARELDRLVADGRYGQAADVANRLLERDPDDAELRTVAAEALLKARLPAWVAQVETGEFDRADAELADMRRFAEPNPDLRPLLAELGWVGDLERFVAGRGGIDTPIRLYADEGPMRDLLARWNDDAKGHQRALARVSAYVPAFRDLHAEALSHLRRLESDQSVYLAAIERLNADLADALARGEPEALSALLDDYAGKYPRLAGIDVLREDLARYVALDDALQRRRLGPLVAVMSRTEFATPPFGAQFERLAATELPPPALVAAWQQAAADWREGRATESVEWLRGAVAGEWADVVEEEAERRQTVAQQFDALRQARGGKGYEERLLAFYASLEPDEDAYFVRATEGDVRAHRAKLVARAKELLDRADAGWRQYRGGGGIGGEQRLEAGVSGAFRTRARQLSQAHADAQQGARLYAMLGEELPQASATLRDEIDAEARLQRQSLRQLHMVLEPAVLKAKLALIGGRGDEE